MTKQTLIRPHSFTSRMLVWFCLLSTIGSAGCRVEDSNQQPANQQGGTNQPDQPDEAIQANYKIPKQRAPDRAETFNQEMRFGMFVCWSFSTFSNVEWTRGVKSVDFFNPTGVDVEQWVETAVDAEMDYILFLTKHHDGFCLWDTDTTDWKVTKSPLGIDVLAQLKKACDRKGIKLALYFSEGDWTCPNNRDAELKKDQLEELLTRYGPIEFIWFDHAQSDGGLGHHETCELIQDLQPNCLVGFNNGVAAGDIRLGELGHAAPIGGGLNNGIGESVAEGPVEYLSAEFTFPILDQGKRRRWFYTMPEWDEVALSAETIYTHYLGAEKDLNAFSIDVGPDRSGRLRSVDANVLAKVGQYIRGELPFDREGSNETEE